MKDCLLWANPCLFWKLTRNYLPQRQANLAIFSLKSRLCYYYSKYLKFLMESPFFRELSRQMIEFSALFYPFLAKQWQLSIHSTRHPLLEPIHLIIHQIHRLTIHDHQLGPHFRYPYLPQLHRRAKNSWIWWFVHSGEEWSLRSDSSFLVFIQPENWLRCFMFGHFRVGSDQYLHFNWKIMKIISFLYASPDFYV